MTNKSGAFRILSSRVICKQLGTPDRPAMKYHAWPTIGKTSSGELIVVFSGDREAHCCPFGANQLIRSLDSGNTWSAPVTVNDTPLDDRDTGVCVLRNGAIVVSSFATDFHDHERSVRNWPHVGDLVVDSWRCLQPHVGNAERDTWMGSWARISGDGGKTWQTPVPMPGLIPPHGPVQLADGRLICLSIVNYFDDLKATGKEPDLYSLKAVESRDHGKSWQVIGDVPRSSKIKVHGGEEPHVVECEDGSLIALVRYHPNRVVSEFQLLQTESKDGGRTWTRLHVVPGVWGGPPHLIRLSSGYLLLSYGYRRAPFGQRACVSRDNGKTWDIENEIILRDDAIDGDLGYPTSVELDDGSIYTVYYQIDKPGEKPCIMGTHWQLPAMYTKAGRAAADKFLGSGAGIREIDLGPRIDARVAEHPSGGKEKKSVVGCIRGINLDKQMGNVASVPNPNVPEQSWTFGSRMEKESGVIAIPGLTGKVKAYDAEGKALRTCSQDCLAWRDELCLPRRSVFAEAGVVRKPKEEKVRECVFLPFSREPVYLVSEDISVQDTEKALRNAVVKGIALTESRAYVGNLDDKAGLVIESRRQTGGVASAQVCCLVESTSEGLMSSDCQVDLEVETGKDERKIIPFKNIRPVDGENLRLHYTIVEQGFPSVAGSTMVGVAVKMEKPPKTDGSDDEWKNVPATVIPGTTLYGKLKTWRGPEDLSARMKLGWDNEALYFLVEVRDDVYMQLGEPCRDRRGNSLPGWRYFYASDSVELCFDRGRLGKSGIFGETDILYFVLAAQAKGQEGAQWGSRNGGTARIASRLEEGGYILEGAIPWEDNFPGIEARAGLAIPFDIKVNDREEDRPAGRQLYDTTYLQSLVWCSSKAAITCDASSYGAIVLVD